MKVAGKPVSTIERQSSCPQAPVGSEKKKGTVGLPIQEKKPRPRWGTLGNERDWCTQV